MAKRFLALLLSCLMFLTLCPATLAAEAAAEEDAAITEAEVTAPLLGSALARDYVQSIQVDLSEPVELVEGLDGDWRTGYDEHDEEYLWFSYSLGSIRNNAQYTVTFTEAGAERYNNGELTFTGRAYQLEQLFFDLEDPYISYQPAMPQYLIHWQLGETHKVRLEFLDVVWQEITVSAVPNPVKNIELAVSGPMELTEGIDGYQSSYWDPDDKEEYEFFQYDVDRYGELQYTVTFSESGAEKYNHGETVFTGTRWEIGMLMGTNPYWETDQYETPWQVGETYQAELWFMNQKWQTASVKILPNPVKNIELTVSGPMELIEGIDGYQSSYWDENNERHEFFRYDVDRYSELQYTVTFSESGAERYNHGKTVFTGTRWEIEELLGVSPGWQDDQYMAPWQVGRTYQAHLWFMERQWQTVDVTIVPNPVVSISAKLPNIVELTEGIDGYRSRYWDENDEPHEYFRYDLDYRNTVQYTVTFSKSGAEKYNGGKLTFTGTQSKIRELLGAWPSWNDDQYENHWQVGETHEARLEFMGKTGQTVSIKILPSPVKSISSDMPKAVTLWENHSGYAEAGRFHYDVDYDRDANYTVTFTAEGAKKYNQGKTTFTGTGQEIGELLGTWPQWEDDQYETPWRVGKTYSSQLSFAGKTWQTVQVTIEACDLPALAAATELSWGKEYRGWDEENPFEDHPGYISWRRNAPAQEEYHVTIYKKNDNGIDTILREVTWRFSVREENRQEYYSVDDFCIADPDTGDYYFTIKPEADYVSYQDGPVVTSGIYHYVRPEAKLPQLAAPQLNETGFTWKGDVPDEGSSTVAMEIYFSETEDGEFYEVGSTRGHSYDEIKFDAEDSYFRNLLAGNGDGYYYVRVRALSDDITRWQNGAWSEPSKLLMTGDNTARVQSALEQISTQAPAEDIREAVQELDKELLLETMATDQDNTGVMEQLAQLEKAVGGPARVEVDEKFSEAFGSDKVSVVGANLNDPTDTGKDITLQVGAPKQDNVIPERYDSTMAVKFSMELDNTDSTELDVPVKIILPVPNNINPRFLAVLHYRHDGSVEEVTSCIYVENGQTYVTFVLTSFSDFAMAQKIYDPCDLNLDDVVNVLDMQALYDLLAQDMEPKSGADCCDVNGDGDINILDYQALYEMVRNC